MSNISALQAARYGYQPKLPAVLKNDLDKIVVEFGKATESVADQTELKELFKNTYGKPEALVKEGNNPDVSKEIKVGVILSGGQAPGGHNVISGLYDGIKKANKKSTLYGFKGGPSGLIECDYVEFTDDFIDAYRNTGGFDIIGSGRTKIETPEQYTASANTAKKLGLDAIVIIGG
nr:6-phosphofructokinase [Treponemataceae bacterium]